MKKLLGMVLVASCVLLTAAVARGAAVKFAYGDFSQTEQSQRTLLVYPIMVSATNAAGITTRDRITRITGLDGTVTISNVMPGWVRAEFQGLWMTSTNWFVIPNTNGLVLASDCLQTNLLLLGSLFPVPWWAKGELGPGRNITFSTNAGRVSINGNGSGMTNLTGLVSFQGRVDVDAILVNGDITPALLPATVLTNNDARTQMLSGTSIGGAAATANAATNDAYGQTIPSLSRSQRFTGTNDFNNLRAAQLIASYQSSWFDPTNLFMVEGDIAKAFLVNVQGNTYVRGELNASNIYAANFYGNGAGITNISKADVAVFADYAGLVGKAAIASYAGVADTANAVSAEVTNTWQAYAQGVTNDYPWTNLTVAHASAVTNGYPWTNITVAHASAVTNGYPWTNLTVAHARAVTNGYPWTNLTVAKATADASGNSITATYATIATVNTVSNLTALGNFIPNPITPTGTPATNILVDPANGSWQCIKLVTNAYITIQAGNASYAHWVRLDITVTNPVYAVTFATNSFVATPVYNISNSTVNTLLFDKAFSAATNNLWRMFQLQ